MLRRRKPYKYNEDFFTLPITNKANPLIEKNLQSLPNETLQKIFEFFSDMPFCVNKNLNEHANDALKKRAKHAIKQFLNDNFNLKLNSLADVNNYLKLINHYQKFCILPADTIKQKQAKFAVLIHMMIELIEYLTKTKTLEFNIANLSPYKPELKLLSSILNSPEEKPLSKNDARNNSDMLISQLGLLKICVSAQKNFFISKISSCWENPIEKPLRKKITFCLDRISHQLNELRSEINPILTLR